VPLPLTAFQRGLLAGDSYEVHAKLLIADADHVLRHISLAAGQDPFISATWQESMDLSCAQGQIVLNRGVGDFNLSPLMLGPASNSPAPALGVKRSFYLATNVTEPGFPPSPSQWQRVLDGVIDNINAAGPDDTIVLEVRDQGGRLLDGTLEESVAFGSLTGTPVEEVMQSLLDFVLPPVIGPHGVTLVTPASPLWEVKQFNYQQAPLLEILRKLALQIGWDLRWRYNGGDTNPSLFFVDPDRNKMVPDLTIGPQNTSTCGTSPSTATIFATWSAAGTRTTSASPIRAKTPQTPLSRPGSRPLSTPTSVTLCS
jgi:hypothetical protein